MVDFVQDGTLGANITQVDTTAEFEVGSRTSGNEGSVYIYCQADGAITGDGYVVLMDQTHQADMIDLTNSAAAFGQQVGVAKAVFADNEFGWIQVAGIANVRVDASAVLNAVLNTTAVSGELDDDGTAGSEDVDRIIINTTNGGAAGLIEGTLTFGTVGATT